MCEECTKVEAGLVEHVDIWLTNVFSPWDNHGTRWYLVIKAGGVQSSWVQKVRAVAKSGSSTKICFQLERLRLWQEGRTPQALSQLWTRSITEPCPSTPKSSSRFLICCQKHEKANKSDSKQCSIWTTQTFPRKTFINNLKAKSKLH